MNWKAAALTTATVMLCLGVSLLLGEYAFKGPLLVLAGMVMVWLWLWVYKQFSRQSNNDD